MHFSKIEGFSVVGSERFRTPTRRERELGLWVDRVGAGTEVRSAAPQKLRQLGLFAAVCIMDGSGSFFSPPTGEIEVVRGDALMLHPEVPASYHPHTRWESRWVVWGGPEAAKIAGLGISHPEAPLVCGGADSVAAAWAEIRPKEFILTAKMARAKELLASRIPVKDVASQLGFREEFYFRRIFRRTTGHTPGSYQ